MGNNSARPINELTGIKKPSSVLIRGASHKEIAIQNGFIPSNWSDAQYVEWAKGARGFSTYELWTQVPGNEDKTLEEFFEFLGFAEAIQEQAILDAIDAQALLVTAAKDDAEQAVVDATAQVTIAEGFAEDAQQSADDAQQIVDDFIAVAPTPASTAEILTGTDAAKYVAPLALAGTFTPSAQAFSATPAPDFANSTYWKTTMTANITSVGAPTNCKSGGTYVMEFLSDGTARTLPAAGSWNSAFDWGSAGFPTMVSGANKRNILVAICVSVSPLKLAITQWKSA